MESSSDEELKKISNNQNKKILKRTRDTDQPSSDSSQDTNIRPTNPHSQMLRKQRLKKRSKLAAGDDDSEESDNTDISTEAISPTARASLKPPTFSTSSPKRTNHSNDNSPSSSTLSSLSEDGFTGVFGSMGINSPKKDSPKKKGGKTKKRKTNKRRKTLKKKKRKTKRKTKRKYSKG